MFCQHNVLYKYHVVHIHVEYMCTYRVGDAKNINPISRSSFLCMLSQHALGCGGKVWRQTFAVGMPVEWWGRGQLCAMSWLCPNHWGQWILGRRRRHSRSSGLGSCHTNNPTFSLRLKRTFWVDKATTIAVASLLKHGSLISSHFSL